MSLGLDQIACDSLLDMIKVLHADKSTVNDHLSDIPVSLISY